MTEIKGNVILEDNPEKIKKLVRLGAIEEECEQAQIPLIEALYWAEKGILDIDKNATLDALRKTDKLIEDKYKILKYLMDGGHVTRASLEGEYFRVHEKGIKRGEDRTKYVLYVVQPDWKPSLENIGNMLEFAGKVRKELLVGYVENNNVIFLKMNRKKF